MKFIALIALFLPLFSFNAKAQIATGPIIGSPFCSCDSIDIPFTSIGVFLAGNTYTAQLSDAAGSFTAAINIGLISSTSNIDTISCAIPCGTITGNGYLLRVISSTPADTGSDNGINIIINTTVIPSITVTANVIGSFCTDTAIFTATSTNGGTLPSYQWQINGLNVGTDSAVYHTSTALTMGDTVSVILTSNIACASTLTAQADTIVDCLAITTGIIAGSPFCACDSMRVPFSSTGNFSVANIYSAQLSDSSGSFAAPVFIGTLASNANIDTITCAIPCGTLTGSGYLIRIIGSAPADTGSDNGINIIVNAVAVPSVSIATNATVELCNSSSITFTATATNGGTTPIYQWQRNGLNVGTNSPVYSSFGTFLNGEIINVTLTSNALCAAPLTSQDIAVIDCPQMDVSNVFTPNGDGVNDIFKVSLNGESLTKFNISIYDRWGILVFNSPNPNYKWDGRTTAGIKVVSGTYYYVLDINDKQQKGFITVLE